MPELLKVAVDPAIPRSIPVGSRDAFGDWEQMVALLSQATHMALRETDRRLRREHDRLGSNVRDEVRALGLTPHVWSDAYARFYDETHAFLFESVTWNRTDLKQAMRDWIVAHLQRVWDGPGRILCFGDGPGFDSAALSLAGHRVTYQEVCLPGRHFAQNLFTHCGVTPDLAGELTELAPGSYDAVVCLDVLEHVPNPAGLVGALANVLRPGGLMIAHAPFWYLDDDVATHLRSNLRYSGDWRSLYGVHGLRPTACRFFWNPIVLEKCAAPQLAVFDRARLTIGGAFLKAQRLWSGPLITTSKELLRREQRRLRPPASESLNESLIAPRKSR